MSRAQRDKAKKLITLALHEGTDTNEAVRAAVEACRLIHQYDLLASPLDDVIDGSGNEAIKAGRAIFEKVSDPEFIADLKKIGQILRGGAAASSESGGRRRRRRRRRE